MGRENQTKGTCCLFVCLKKKPPWHLKKEGGDTENMFANEHALSNTSDDAPLLGYRVPHDNTFAMLRCCSQRVCYMLVFGVCYSVSVGRTTTSPTITRGGVVFSLCMGPPSLLPFPKKLTSFSASLRGAHSRFYY